MTGRAHPAARLALTVVALLTASRSASAQRLTERAFVVRPAVRAMVIRTTRDMVDTAAAPRTGWNRHSAGEKSAIRAGTTTLGFVAGALVFGGAGVLIEDCRHSSSDYCGLGAALLGVVGSGVGTVVGSSMVGGRGTGACRRGTRVLRAVGGYLAGTAAGAIMVNAASRGGGRAEDVAIVAFPVLQIVGATAANEGC